MTIADGVPLPDPIDTPRQIRSRRALAASNRKLELPAGAPLAVHVDCPEQSEDELLDLIDAWSAVVAQRGNARLWLVGEVLDRGRALERIHRKGMLHHVIAAGLYTDLADLLQAADIYVATPGQIRSSLVVLQAMAAGLPVVVARPGEGDPPLPEPEGGLLVSEKAPKILAESILRLFDTPSLRANLGTASRDFVATRHSLAACAEQHRQLFERLVEEKALRAT